MSYQDKGVNIFTQLGLTIRQAEVYLAAVKLGHPTVKSIAQTLQIARAEIYRTTPELQKLGLIKKNITKPISFMASPLSEGFSILLKRKAEEHEKIERQAEKFLRNFNRNIEKPSPEISQYYITSGLKAESREYIRDLETLQTSSDNICFDWEFVQYWSSRNFEVIKKAIERGVKMRCITHIPEGEKIPQNIKTLMKTGSFEIKCASTVSKAGIDILDKKRVHIITMPKDHWEELEVLRSQDPGVADLAQDYFELKWQSATTPCWYKNTRKLRKNKGITRQIQNKPSRKNDG